MHTLLHSALVPKGRNFIAPLALIQQFLIALFFPYSAHCETQERAIEFGKIKSRITCFNKHAQFFMERKNEQAKSIFRQSAILLARDNSKIFCVNWAHKKIVYNGNWKFL